jgi:hypothetical protein
MLVAPRHVAAASFRGTKTIVVVQANARTPREETLRTACYSPIAIYQSRLLGAFRVGKPGRIRESWDGNGDSQLFPGARKEGIMRRCVYYTCQAMLTAFFLRSYFAGILSLVRS